MNGRILQVVGLGIVCLTTWVALTPVRAQFGAGPRGSQPSRSVAGIKQVIAPETVPADRMRLSPSVSSYANDSFFTVQLDANNQAVVDSSVELGDTSPGQTYMWVLRSKSEDNTTLATALYDHQRFEVTPVRVMTPTFHEVITVPPGVSWVRLTLYRFPSNLDPALFEEEGKVDQYSLISRSQKVDVR